MSIDELWESPLGGARSWYDRATPELKEFLDELVDKILERGSDPNWAAALRHIEREFPAEAPATTTTLRETTRRLIRVKE